MMIMMAMLFLWWQHNYSIFYVSIGRFSDLNHDIIALSGTVAFTENPSVVFFFLSKWVDDNKYSMFM